MYGAGQAILARQLGNDGAGNYASKVARGGVYPGAAGV